MNKDKMVLVDGNNLLFRMFFGMPNKIYNAKGHLIHGTIGFIGTLLAFNNDFLFGCCNQLMNWLIIREGGRAIGSGRVATIIE